MKEELEKDGLAENMKPQLDELEKFIEMEKEQFLRLKMNEIIPFIEEELTTRYWFQEAGVSIRLRYDNQLKKALSSNHSYAY
jgi:carboxyl-terminal processing protease